MSLEGRIVKRRFQIGGSSIRNRILLLFTLLIVLPLLTVSTISYFSVKAYIERLVVSQKLEIGRSISNEINLIRERDEKLSNQIMLNSIIQQALVDYGNGSNLDRYNRKTQVNSLLASMIDSIDVLKIAIFNEKGLAFHSNDMSPILNAENLEESVIRQKLLVSGGQNVWIPLQEDLIDGTATGPHLYLARKINDLKWVGSQIGLLIMQFHYGRIESIIRQGASGEGEYSVLLNEAAEILCHSTDSSKVGTLYDSSTMAIMREGKESFYQELDGQRYLTISIRPKHAGWTVLELIPYQTIVRESERIRNIIFIAMLLCLTAAVVVSLFFSKDLTAPIIRLKKTMDGFGEGKLHLRATAERQDELGKLVESFNKMADDINRLLVRVDEEHRQRVILELNLLEYQINPHFLYNTLDSINWMAHKSGQHEIGDMVNALARFFRIGLSKGKEFIEIRQELEHASSYLMICRIRYRDCFEYEMMADEGVPELKTLKVILQPILENALKHGIDREEKGGLIKIQCTRQEQAVLMSVSDNGRGMPPERLQQLLESLEKDSLPEETEGGFGLNNVNRRLKLNFGPEWGLSIQSIPGEGTMVTVRVPVLH